MTTESSITEYNVTATALAGLQDAYRGRTYAVATPAGMKLAIAARAELRDLRVSLEVKRVEIKNPALERCRLIDAEAKRITSELRALEDPIDGQIKAEEKRRADAKLAAERAESERLVREAEAVAAARRAEEDRLAAEKRARAEAALGQIALELAAERERLEADRRLLVEARNHDDALAAAARQRLDDAAASQRQAEADAAAARRAEADRLAAVERARQQLEVEEQTAEFERKRKADADAAGRVRAAQEETQIASTSLVEAAALAVDLLRTLGYGDHLTTRALAAAVGRAAARVRVAR